MKEYPLKNSRQFTYLSTKDKYPLELKGNMKKRPSTTNKQNSGPYVMAQPQKNKLIDKISQNYRDLKSIVPKDFDGLELRENKKSCSNGRMSMDHKSGIAYLESRSQIEVQPRGRKQIKSKSELFEGPKSVRKQGKKTFAASQMPQNKENEFRPHSQTLKIKIDNDLHANHFLPKKASDQNNECERTTKSQSHKNNIKNYQGQILGYEKQRRKILCEAKQRQIMGSMIQTKNKYSGILNEERSKKSYRQDFMKSTFQLG